MKPVLTLTLENDLAELERVGREVNAFAETHQLPARVAFDADLCLDEVLTNIISYAYDDDAAHEIVVRLSLARDASSPERACELLIDVEDDGRPFDPLEVAAPDVSGPVEERPVGGLGLRLVRKLMTRLEYQRRDGKNVLRMCRVVD